MFPMGKDNIIVWNVRGLNSRVRRDVMRELVAAELPTFVCLQETKLNVFNNYDMLQLLGHGFGYAFLPFVQT
jgi:exonuclease III